MMNKKEILEKSRSENKDKDLFQLEVELKAGKIASQVGTVVCCVLSIVLYIVTRTFLYSPWIIYFSILGTKHTVQYIKGRYKADLWICVSYMIMLTVSLIFFVLRILSV